MKLLTRWGKQTAYIDDDGIIRVVEEPFHVRYDYSTLLYDMMSECGYTNFNQDSRVRKLIMNSDGKSFEEVKRFLSNQVTKNRKHAKQREEKFNAWQEYLSKHGDYVIAIDKHIDDFPNGFNIFVSMRSCYSRREQAEYIRTNKEEFLNIITTWFQTICRKKKYVDLLPFCRITEITVTNQSEAKVTFEFKEELHRSLKELKDRRNCP